LQLPDPHLRILPELADQTFPDEPLASCASCAMTVPNQPVVFTAAARCCTYHPRLPNFLAGRALRRADIGSQRVRARMEQGEGVTAMGIQPTSAWLERWGNRTPTSFGRDEALTCPYWVAGGALGCSIHPDRESVCRTWHCKLSHGARSQAVWEALHSTLAGTEETIAQFCLDHVPSPPPPGASAQQHADFYVACAARVDALTEADLAVLRTPSLVERAELVRRRSRERDLPMPEVLEPRVREILREEGRLRLASWSPFDVVEVPPWIFELLSRLDGQRPWKEAVASARAAGFPATDALVERLWARGLLGTPTSS
jgi:hypothetical protein